MVFMGGQHTTAQRVKSFGDDFWCGSRPTLPVINRTKGQRGGDTSAGNLEDVSQPAVGTRVRGASLQAKSHGVRGPSFSTMAPEGGLANFEPWRQRLVSLLWCVWPSVLRVCRGLGSVDGERQPVTWCVVIT